MKNIIIILLFVILLSGPCIANEWDEQILESTGSANIVLEGFQILDGAYAHSQMEVKVKIKNQGPDSIYLHTELWDNREGEEFIRVHRPYYIPEAVEAKIGESVEEKFYEKPIEIILADGTMEKRDLTTKTIKMWEEPYEEELVNIETGEIMHTSKGGGEWETLNQQTVLFNPGESIELNYVTDVLRRNGGLNSGMHKITVKLKTNDVGDPNPNDNILINNIDVMKRPDFVLKGPVTPEQFAGEGEVEFPELYEELEIKEGEYWINDYEEYANENGDLCTKIEEKDICILRQFDGEYYPYAVDGQKKKVGIINLWIYKIFAGEEDPLYKYLGGIFSVNINGVKISYMDVGWKIKL